MDVVGHEIDARRECELRDRRNDQREIRRTLLRRRQTSREPVRSQIANQQRGLKEDETRRPYRRRPAQQRQNAFRRYWLDQKQQPAAEKDGDRVTTGVTALLLSCGSVHLPEIEAIARSSSSARMSASSSANG